ncbi:hypothetical protein [Lysinibacillus sp.]|uniref:hypothetical protein n=1 Tax=Lysinibacillus sp. TaxID=1869345 RepID=UPI0028AA3DB4|nr:hypothetical protein [Lysinibacillus sp.]
MGLNFSHCDVGWSYSGFNNFRRRLAQQIEMDLDDMVGFGGNIPFHIYQDDIVPLLNHSDCDGELTPDECKQVAPRLRELVSGWEDDYEKSKALDLADGMELAANRGKSLEFR